MKHHPIHFEVSLALKKQHLFEVKAIVLKPQALQNLSLAAWIPGSYLIREFSKHLQLLKAKQGKKQLAIIQLDKANWQVACDPEQPLELSYQVYAHDHSVRTAWLENTRGFFNPTSLCLQVEGQTHVPHSLSLSPTPDIEHWRVATGAWPEKTNRLGWGLYSFQDFDELADNPFEIGDLWHGAFKVRGIEHQLVVSHAPPTFNGEQLLADTQKICQAQIEFWHGKNKKSAPHNRYTFMLATVDEGYGGLEHQHSTALICKRSDLPQIGKKASAAYHDLLGLISHEYFHTWNVKRMRPTELHKIDYAKENYTELLWFFEGFTSYYDDVILARTGLITEDQYLNRLSKTLEQVHYSPGRKVQTVAQASFDAWIKYYRIDENTINHTVSYYTKGSLVALCLDLTLRQEGKISLDDVMRDLWQSSKGGPISEQDIAHSLHKLSGRSFQAQLKAWVHSTEELPCLDLLKQQGVKVLEQESSLALSLGLKAKENPNIVITQVLFGSAASKAGFSPQDEWYGVALKNGKQKSQWRLQKIDDLELYASPNKTVQALVARDKRLIELELSIPARQSVAKLSTNNLSQVQQWLLDL